MRLLVQHRSSYAYPRPAALGCPGPSCSAASVLQFDLPVADAHATFLTALDPDYIVIMEWISQGAPL